MSDVLLAYNTLSERQSELEKAENYYYGTQDEVFASPKLRRALKNTGTSFRLNFAKTPVEAVLNRLEIVEIGSPNPTARNVIKDVSAFNELEIEISDIHRWALVYGDAYLMVWPDEQGNIELTYNSPRVAHLFYDPEHPRRKRFGAKVWNEGDKVRVNLYYRDRIEKYVSKTAKPKRDSDFEPFVDAHTDENGAVPNPFGEVPLFHFRTERPYGRPEHFDAYAPQDMINKLVITQMASNDFHGFPQRYLISGGASSELTDFNEDSTNALETPSLTTGPGELWFISSEGDVKVGQFDAAAVDNFLKPMENYIRAIASTTSTPFHFFDPHGEVPSGESLRVAEAPLNKKVRTRQMVFGATWKEVFGFVLSLREVRAEVNVRWAPPESMDSLDAWSTAKVKREVGLPLKQVLIEAGYSEQAIEAFMKEAPDSPEAPQAA